MKFLSTMKTIILINQSPKKSTNTIRHHFQISNPETMWWSRRPTVKLEINIPNNITKGKKRGEEALLGDHFKKGLVLPSTTFNRIYWALTNLDFGFEYIDLDNVGTVFLVISASSSTNLCFYGLREFIVPNLISSPPFRLHLFFVRYHHLFLFFTQVVRVK